MFRYNEGACSERKCTHGARRSQEDAAEQAVSTDKLPLSPPPLESGRKKEPKQLTLFKPSASLLGPIWSSKISNGLYETYVLKCMRLRTTSILLGVRYRNAGQVDQVRARKPPLFAIPQL